MCLSSIHLSLNHFIFSFLPSFLLPPNPPPFFSLSSSSTSSSPFFFLPKKKKKLKISKQAAALTASGTPDSLTPLYAYLQGPKSPLTDAEKGQVSARLQDVLGKAWTLVGVPLVVAAMAALARGEGEWEGGHGKDGTKLGGGDVGEEWYVISCVFVWVYYVSSFFFSLFFLGYGVFWSIWVCFVVLVISFHGSCYFILFGHFMLCSFHAFLIISYF